MMGKVIVFKMKITNEMKEEFMEMRYNMECKVLPSFSTLQQVKGRIQLDTMIDKYGKKVIEKIAKTLDKENSK